MECNGVLPVEDLIRRLNFLTEQKGKIKSYAPQIPILAFKLAKANARKIEAMNDFSKII